MACVVIEYDLDEDFDVFNTRRRPTGSKEKFSVLVRHFSPLFRIGFHRCVTVRFAFCSILTNRYAPLKNRTLLLDYKILPNFAPPYTGRWEYFAPLQTKKKYNKEKTISIRKWSISLAIQLEKDRLVGVYYSFATKRGLYKSVFIVNATSILLRDIDFERANYERRQIHAKSAMIITSVEDRGG